MISFTFETLTSSHTLLSEVVNNFFFLLALEHSVSDKYLLRNSDSDAQRQILKGQRRLIFLKDSQFGTSDKSQQIAFVFFLLFNRPGIPNDTFHLFRDDERRQGCDRFLLF